MSDIWHPVAGEADFPEEGKIATEIAGWHVLVVRGEGGFTALNNRCSHQSALLSGGKVRRGAVMCPLHGARFDVTTGACIGGAYAALRLFPLRIAGGTIEIALPPHPPGPGDLPIIL